MSGQPVIFRPLTGTGRCEESRERQWAPLTPVGRWSAGPARDDRSTPSRSSASSSSGHHFVDQTPRDLEGHSSTKCRAESHDPAKLLHVGILGVLRVCQQLFLQNPRYYVLYTISGAASSSVCSRMPRSSSPHWQAESMFYICKAYRYLDIFLKDL